MEMIKKIIRANSATSEVVKQLDPSYDPTKNSFWAIASKEIADADGEVILIDGIDLSAHDPINGKYMPILASHNVALESGQPSTIGRVEQFQTIEIDGTKALAFLFSFAFNADGQPIDELVKSHYDRYRAGYMNKFSIGAMYAEKVKGADAVIIRECKLYEISLVSIGANEDAIALTKELTNGDENMMTEEQIKMLSDCHKMLSEYQPMLANANKALDAVNPMLEASNKAVCDAIKAINDRLDLVEALAIAEPDEEEKPEETPVENTEKALAAELSKLLNRIKK